MKNKRKKQSGLSEAAEKVAQKNSELENIFLIHYFLYVLIDWYDIINPVERVDITMLKANNQLSFCLSSHASLFDVLIEKNNFWRQLKDMVDFSFVYDELKEKYSSTMGRKAEDVVRMFKYLLLKNYYKLSDRDLIARTNK